MRNPHRPPAVEQNSINQNTINNQSVRTIFGGEETKGKSTPLLPFTERPHMEGKKKTPKTPPPCPNHSHKATGAKGKKKKKTRPNNRLAPCSSQEINHAEKD